MAIIDDFWERRERREGDRRGIKRETREKVVRKRTSKRPVADLTYGTNGNRILRNSLASRLLLSFSVARTDFGHR